MTDGPPMDPALRALGRYRRLQLLYPGTFRARYGQEMQELFWADWVQANERGGRGRASLWLRLVLDCGRSLPREWIAALPRAYRGPIIRCFLAIFGALVGAYLNHELPGVMVLWAACVIPLLVMQVCTLRGLTWAACGVAVFSGPLVYGGAAGAGLGVPSGAITAIAAFLCGTIGLGLSSIAIVSLGLVRKAEGKPVMRRGLGWVVAVLAGVSMIVGLLKANPDSHAVISCCIINNTAFVIAPTVVRCWKMPAQG